MRYKNLHKSNAEMPSKMLNQTSPYVYGLYNNKLALLGWNFSFYIKCIGKEQRYCEKRVIIYSITLKNNVM